jgi:hypothetical protein
VGSARKRTNPIAGKGQGARFGHYSVRGIGGAQGCPPGDGSVLSDSDISKIEGAGGAQALQALRDHYCELTASPLRFSHADIVKIAANGGGAQALQAVRDHYGELTASPLGFSGTDIVKIAGNIGGAQALQVVLDRHGPTSRVLLS